jgi:archaellum component FlaC
VSDTDTSTALAAGAAAATAERAAEDVQELAQETETTLGLQQSQIDWQAEVQRMIETELAEVRSALETQAAILDEVIARLDLLESEYTEEPGENVEDVTTLEGETGDSESPEDQAATDEPEPDPQPQGKHKKRAMGLW